LGVILWTGCPCRCKATWKRKIKLSWREAGPPVITIIQWIWTSRLSIKNPPSQEARDLEPLLAKVLAQTMGEVDYTGTSIIKKRNLLGPYRWPVPGVLGES